MFTKNDFIKTTPSPRTLMSKSWVFAASILGTLALMTGCAGNDPTAGEEPVPPPPTSPPPTSSPNTDGTQPPNDADPTPDNVTILNDQTFNVTSTDIVSIDCDGGGEINVLIDGAQFTVTGSCEEIDIDGHNNQINVFDTDDLDIDGDNNSIQAKNIIDVDISGSNNMVEASSIATEIDVEGSNNSVTYGSGSPKIEDEGTGNMITKD